MPDGAMQRPPSVYPRFQSQPQNSPQQSMHRINSSSTMNGSHPDNVNVIKPTANGSFNNDISSSNGTHYVLKSSEEVFH